MEYKKVWQTWSLCNAHERKQEELETNFVVDEAKSEMRHRVQKARIAKRMSLQDLSQVVKCDIESLASYERGDGVISNDVLERIMKSLNLK